MGRQTRAIQGGRTQTQASLPQGSVSLRDLNLGDNLMASVSRIAARLCELGCERSAFFDKDWFKQHHQLRMPKLLSGHGES